jgi:penicillin-binding protein 2
MKFEDFSQNLGARIATIQAVAVILLAVLGVRLYFLQLVKGDYYANRAENQRIRKIRMPAPRGAIFDRNGKLLVDSRSTYNVTLAPEAIKDIDPNERAQIYADGLGIAQDYLNDRMAAIKKKTADFETFVIKENADLADITWVEAHSLEYPELHVELQPQRHYPLGKSLAHVLGYVGEIGPKQLEDPTYKDFTPGDVIGKGGLEQYYDSVLRGKDGYKKVVVDSRGRLKEEIETVPPQPGQDLVTTIDLDLQVAAEASLEHSATKRGAMVVTDPNNGEVLAMASAPSFDPNVFVSGSATPEGRREIAKYYTDPDHPLLNRAIQGRYHPGSTWKVPESVAALNQGAITVQHSNVLCGGGITIGNKHTRCMGNHGSPPLPYAITKSCDGYFYRLGLKMGIDGLVKMAEMWQFDKPTGVDLPNEKTPHTPKYWRASKEKQYGGKWPDIETVYASIGQVTVEMTPLSMIRAISSVGVGGRMFIPHLLKEFRAIGAIGEPDSPDFVPAKDTLLFDRPDPVQIPLTTDQQKLIVDGMWGVVNNGGTAAAIKIPGFPLAGKTGTAQVAELGKDTGKNKDHSWFVSYAPAYKPEIAIIAIIENAGFGAQHAGPAVRGVYEAYLQKRQGPSDMQMSPLK